MFRYGKKSVKLLMVLSVLLVSASNLFARDIVKELQSDFDKHPTLKKAGFKVIVKGLEHGFLTLYEPKRPVRRKLNSKWDMLKRKAEQLARNYPVKDVIWDEDIDSDFLNAIRTGKTGHAKGLLSKGADTNARDASGTTALMYAARYSPPEMVRFLLNNGADVSALDNHNQSALKYAQEWNQKKTVILLKTKLDSLFRDLLKGLQERMVLVKGGCFKMGDTFGDGYDSEKPVHEVCVSDYYISKYEATQKEWKKIMRSNPSEFKNCGSNCPVEQVSWDDVQAYISKLNDVSGFTFRLPTEAEWEYAARGKGKKIKYSGTGNDKELYKYANFCDVNCGQDWKDKSQNDGYGKTAPVGSYKPNSLGLYDMTGNVWEWVQDWYGKDYYGKSVKENPAGPKSGSFRVDRGGSWSNGSRNLRASDRGDGTPDGRHGDLGFRLARTP